MSFDFAFSCSPQIQQIPDLRALTVLLSFSLPGVRSTSPRKGQPCLSTQASSLFIYHPPPFVHLTFITVYFVPVTVLSDRLETKSNRVRNKGKCNNTCNLVCAKCCNGSKRYSMNTKEGRFVPRQDFRRR